MSQQQDNKFFYMNLKKKVSKNGKVFYTNNKFAYAIELICFEKKDGSGDLTCWLQPVDMDKMKQNQQGRQETPRPQQSRPPSPNPYANEAPGAQIKTPPKNPQEPPAWDDQDPGYPEF